MRIGYEDSTGGKGELDMPQVRIGDIVRFISDFHKVGPNVRKDELGEVTATSPERLSVRAPATSRHGDTEEYDDFEVEVEPGDVVVVVAPDDERTKGRRTESRPMGLQELQARLAAAASNRVDLFDRGMLLVELRRDAPALRLVRSASRASWASLLTGLGFGRRLVARTTSTGIDLDFVEWAFKAMFDDFLKARGRIPRMGSREDMIWCLKSLAQDASLLLVEPGMAFDEDEKGNLKAVEKDLLAEPAKDIEDWKAAVAKLHDAAAKIDAMSNEQWSAEVGIPYQKPEEQAEVPEPQLIEDVKEEETEAPTLIRRRPDSTSYVYAQPKMEVVHTTVRPVKTGIITALSGPNALVVFANGKSEFWDARETALKPGWKGPFQEAPHEVVAEWRRNRGRAPKQKRSEWEGALVIDALDSTAELA